MTPDEQEEADKKNFYTWIFSLEPIEEELTIKQQIKIANKKRLKAVKKENYLKAAKYRDLITQLKQQNE